MLTLRIIIAALLLSGSLFAQQKDFIGAGKYVVIPDENDSVRAEGERQNMYVLTENLAITTNSQKAFDADSTSILDSLANYKASLPVLRDTGFVERNDLYTYNDKMLRIVQSHDRATVAHFDPEDVPALYTFREPGCPEWVQPIGAQDAYNIGDCVIFNGVQYESNINANVWSPTVTPQYWDEK